MEESRRVLSLDPSISSFRETKTTLCQCLVTLDFSLAFILAILLPLVALLVVSWTVEFHFHPVSRLHKTKGQQNSTANAEGTTNFTHYEKRMNSMNLHPILMSVGLFLLPAYNIVLFRACCCYCRGTVQWFHTVLSVLSLVCGAVGIVSVQPFYSEPSGAEVASFQTFHSLMGLLVMVVHVLQSLSALFVFVVMKVVALLPSAMFRFQFVPYHFHVGFSLFIGGVIGVITGLSHLPILAFPPLAAELMMEPGITRYGEALTGLVTCHLAVALSTVAVYYVMTKEDFRVRGRVMMARD